MGSLLSLCRNQYIFMGVHYVFKSVKVLATPINDAKVVLKFLKNIFMRFGVPRAIISDRGHIFATISLSPC